MRAIPNYISLKIGVLTRTIAANYVTRYVSRVMCSIQDISDYIDSQLISYLVNETATNRRVMADDRVHCCLYILSPHSTAKYI